jgi:hypothetical protein
VVTEKEEEVEQAAVRAFAVLWWSVVGREDRVIPDAQTCRRTFEGISKDPGRSDLLELCRRIAEYKKKYGATEYGGRYGSLYDLAKQVAEESKKEAHSGSEPPAPPAHP